MALVGSAVALAAVGVHSQAGASGRSSIQLEGAWRVSANWLDMGGMEVVAHALANFDGHCGVIETPQTPDGVSTGHGSYVHLGNRYYDIRVVYFTYDAMGAPDGTTEVRSQVRVNSAGNWFNGRFRKFTLNMDGKLVTDFDGLVEAERITVE